MDSMEFDRRIRGQCPTSPVMMRLPAAAVRGQHGCVAWISIVCTRSGTWCRRPSSPSSARRNAGTRRASSTWTSPTSTTKSSPWATPPRAWRPCTATTTRPSRSSWTRSTGITTGSTICARKKTGITTRPSSMAASPASLLMTTTRPISAWSSPFVMKSRSTLTRMSGTWPWSTARPAKAGLEWWSAATYCSSENTAMQKTSLGSMEISGLRTIRELPFLAKGGKLIFFKSKKSF